MGFGSWRAPLQLDLWIGLVRWVGHKEGEDMLRQSYQSSGWGKFTSRGGDGSSGDNFWVPQKIPPYERARLLRKRDLRWVFCQLQENSNLSGGNDDPLGQTSHSWGIRRGNWGSFCSFDYLPCFPRLRHQLLVQQTQTCSAQMSTSVLESLGKFLFLPFFLSSFFLFFLPCFSFFFLILFVKMKIIFNSKS